MADTGPIPLPGPRDDPDGAYLRRKAAAALAAFEAAMAAPSGGCHICAVFEFHSTLRDLAAQFTRIAYDEDKGDQREDRAYRRGFADGATARARRPRRGVPRPRWLRAAD
jgi:acyl transferase domain-containing protein